MPDIIKPIENGKNEIISLDEARKIVDGYQLPKPKREKKRRQAKPQSTDEGGKPQVINADEFLLLKDIVCVDADGNEFEQYPELYIAKDIVRTSEDYEGKPGIKKHATFTPYKAIVHFEQRKNGLFLPSFALSCNILAALYHNKDDDEVKRVLDQYKNYGAGYGWHAQNTVVAWGDSRIVHNPRADEFQEHGGEYKINQGKRRTALSYNRKGLSTETLDKALKKSNGMRFTQQFTGLKNPSILLEIGEYFGKTPYLYVTSENDTRAAWLGCDSDDFNIIANNNLSSNNGARGVHAQKNFQRK